jgi:hypothetical protein
MEMEVMEMGSTMTSLRVLVQAKVPHLHTMVMMLQSMSLRVR